MATSENALLFGEQALETSLEEREAGGGGGAGRESGGRCREECGGGRRGTGGVGRVRGRVREHEESRFKGGRDVRGVDAVTAMEEEFFDASTDVTAVSVSVAMLESVVAASDIEDDAVKGAEIVDAIFAAKPEAVSGGLETGA